MGLYRTQSDHSPAIMHQSLVALMALGISCVSTGLVLGYARRRLLDQVNERSSHQTPTPRGGGLGLSLGLLGAWLTAAWSGLDVSLVMLATALTLMTALGWWDDHASLPARWRLVAQFLIAGLALAAIGIPTQATLGGWILSAPLWLIWLVALVGVVWLVNLTNFMDGIDGIAGGQGLVAGISAGLLLAASTADVRWAFLGWATAGACAGFLIWNQPPARIFMGDVGSTTLGLVFACLVLAELHAGVALDVALLPLAPFILDATGTLARRAWRREHLSQAHRSHLYQRLARHWGGHGSVTLVYTGLAGLAGGAAWATHMGHLPSLTGALGVAMIFTLLATYGRRVAPA